MKVVNSMKAFDKLMARRQALLADPHATNNQYRKFKEDLILYFRALIKSPKQSTDCIAFVKQELIAAEKDLLVEEHMPGYIRSMEQMIERGENPS
jgi:hypothetical protein